MGGPFDDNEILVLTRGYLVMNLVVADKIVRPHGGNEHRYRKLRSAQGVELLVEQSSMPSMESVARVAFALRNDLTVNNLAPFSKRRALFGKRWIGSANAVHGLRHDPTIVLQ